MLDTMRQVETHLIQRHYDGFLRKGRLRGRFDRTPVGRGEAVAQTAKLWLYAGIALLVVCAAAIFIARELLLYDFLISSPSVAHTREKGRGLHVS